MKHSRVSLKANEMPTPPLLPRMLPMPVASVAFLTFVTLCQWSRCTSTIKRIDMSDSAPT